VPDEPRDFSHYSARDLLQKGTAFLDANRVDDATLMLFTLCERFSTADEPVPPHVLSLYALCLARQGKRKEAVDIGRTALKRGGRSALCRLHMAKIYLLAESRRKAFEELERGFALAPNHPDLMRFRREMGVRQKPVIAFLSRDNPINVKLGKARSGKKRIR
jgi:predicted Zn-dependent protease